MKILIVEDEVLAFIRLKKMVEEISPKPISIEHTDSISSTIAWFKENKQPDLLFLDIEISDGNSFEIFKHISIDSPIIFTTAYDQFAIDAFKVNSVDYLLKPIKKDLLELAFQKFERFHINQVANSTGDFSQTYKSHMVIKLGQKIIPLAMDEIAYIYSKEKVTYYCNTKGQVFPTYTSLDKIQEELNPTIFFRINRQLIAHKNAIVDIKTTDKSKILIKLNPNYSDDIVISTEKSSLFKKWLTS
ncbi:MAG: LytTR family DNA-binding domain-containing protein [Chitinophagaceae bacterium]